MWWIALCVLLSLFVVALVVLLWPWRLELSMHGRGEPSGGWVIAGGGQIGPLSATGVAGHGVPPQLQIDLWRWKLWRRDFAELLPEPEPEPEENRPSLGDRYRQLERWVDPDELAAFLTGEHRRLELESLYIRLEYSFSDVVLTGSLFGAICALDAMLPARVCIRQTPDWEAVDRAGGSMNGKIKLRPGLLLFDGLKFSVKHLKLRKHHGNGREAEQNRG